METKRKKEAAAIVAQLTLEEKVALCSGENLWYLKGLERFNIPSIMITDGPHGLRKTSTANDFVRDLIPATCFPTASALASSWDEDLISEVGMALGKECVKEDVAVLLGPGMNIKRHPCCGRNFEYFSEDPYLSGRLAAALVKGVQSQGVGSCIKHICVNNQEHDRMRVNAVVDERTLREIYLRGFEIAIKEAQPWTVMCAYNRLNGQYCSEHDQLWNKILRDKWGFEGLVMTDWGATNNRVKGIAAGLDLEMPGSHGAHDAQVIKAVEEGRLSMDQIDPIAERNIDLSLRGKDVLARKVHVDMEDHHALARRVAMQCAVLLKNTDDLLPLTKNTPVAVIGEFAKKPRYQGMGSSQVRPTQLNCAWDRLVEYSSAISYAPGYSHDNNGEHVDQSLIDEAVDAARHAQVAIVFAGLPGICESEGFDRSNMNMPRQHNALIEAVCDANPNTVVVLSNGQAVAMPWVEGPKAILEGYLAGQAGGSALVDLLFRVASPCGKLAETFPIRVEDVAADAWFPGNHHQVQYREGLNVGYRFFDTAKEPVLFPFGHGLSYTTFEYSSLRVGDPSDEADLKVELEVRNSGNMTAAEIVQCYIHDCETTVYRPEQELKAFNKVLLQPGETKTVTFNLDKNAFSFYDTGAQKWVVETGDYEIRIGSSSRDIRLVGVTHLTGETPSAQVRTAYSSQRQIESPLKVSDADFARMLGRAPPPSEKHKGLYHENSLVGDLHETWLGSLLANKVIAETSKHMQGDEEDEAVQKMAVSMANGTPLRGLVLFSRGNLSFHGLDVFLALLNGQYVQSVYHGYREIKFRLGFRSSSSSTVSTIPDDSESGWEDDE